MLQRAITGGVFVATLLFFSTISNLSVFLLYAVFVGIGAYEYTSIIKKNSENSPNTWIAIILTLLLFIIVSGPNTLEMSEGYLLPIFLILFFGVFLRELYSNKPNPFNNIAHTIMPSMYVGLPFGLLLLANQFVVMNAFAFDQNYVLILGFYFMLWSNDTGAYLSGKAFGKHKLFERISPNKTWEGSVGGALLAMIVAGVNWYFFGGLELWMWLVIGLIIAIIGSMGDLVESLFKRSMNVKDSGKIMPGHGGILDRFDGLLISAPFVYAFLQIVL